MINIEMLYSDQDAEITRDFSFAKKVKALHVKSTINALFLNPKIPYPLLRNYCTENEEGHPIKLQDIVGKDTKEQSIEIKRYLKENPQDTNITYITEQDYDSRIKLSNLLKESPLEVVLTEV